MMPHAMKVGPGSALFYGPTDRKRWDDYLTVMLSDAIRRIPAGSVGPTVDFDKFKRELHGLQSPRDLVELLPWVIDQLQHGVVQLRHPRHSGLFNPSPSFLAVCAERITAAFSPQLATSTTSPVPVEIEARVIRSVAHRLVFPSDASGHLTTGGSEANYTALVCALTLANARFAGAIARGVAASGLAWVLTTTFCGHDALRMCIRNGQTTSQDILALAAPLTGKAMPDPHTARTRRPRQASKTALLPESP